MSKLIHITRNGNTVSFETVNVVTTDLVVWQNDDPQTAHWPSLSLNQLGAAPSPNSNDTPLAAGGPAPPAPPVIQPPAPPPNVAFVVYTTCALHPTPAKPTTPIAPIELGIINVFNPFAAGIPGSKTPFTLPAATTGLAITAQTVAAGGMSPYKINSLEYQITGQQPAFATPVPNPPGPPGAFTFLGLTLTPTANNAGLSLNGIPSKPGTYNFTFDVTDGMGLNIQQSQFSMVVT